MNDASTELSALATSLPPSERLKLVEHLLDSLDAPDPEIDRVWAAEAEERLTAFRRGELSAVSSPTRLRNTETSDDQAACRRPGGVG